MLTFVVGRDAELASLHDFVKRVVAGTAALVLEGEAEMGKTTLWRAGVEAAETAGRVSCRRNPPRARRLSASRPDPRWLQP